MEDRLWSFSFQSIVFLRDLRSVAAASPSYPHLNPPQKFFCKSRRRWGQGGGTPPPVLKGTLFPQFLDIPTPSVTS